MTLYTLIKGISTNKKTVAFSSVPHKLPAENKVYFTVANVVDNTKEVKKSASATILKTDFAYGIQATLQMMIVMA